MVNLIAATLIVVLSAASAEVSNMSYCSGYLGLLPNPADCRGFIHCRSHQMALFYFCRPGFAYDPNVKFCTKINNIPNCDPNTGKRADDKIYSNDKNSVNRDDMLDFCERHGSGIFDITDNPSRGIFCLAGKFSQSYQCEQGTVFTKRPVGCHHL